MGKGNGFYYINPSHVMNGYTCKGGQGRRESDRTGLRLRLTAAPRCTLFPCKVVNTTFLSLWDCQLECKGNGRKGL